MDFRKSFILQTAYTLRKQSTPRNTSTDLGFFRINLSAASARSRSCFKSLQVAYFCSQSRDNAKVSRGCPDVINELEHFISRSRRNPRACSVLSASGDTFSELDCSVSPRGTNATAEAFAGTKHEPGENMNRLNITYSSDAIGGVGCIKVEAATLACSLRRERHFIEPRKR